jgi:tetratricopeptide (TPR) repeat protein
VFPNKEEIQKSQAFLNKAKEAWLKGRRDIALVSCKQALDLSPNHTDTQYLMAVLYRETGQLRLAGELLAKLRKAEPDRVNIFFQSGMLQLNLNRSSESIHFFKRALELNPKHFPSLLNIGKALQGLGNLGGALDYFYRANQIEHENVAILRDMGAISSKLGRLEESNRYFSIAYSLDPTDLLTILGWAEAMEFFNKLDEAEKYVQFALEQQPENSKALLVAGIIERRKNNFDQALKYLQSIDESSLDLAVKSHLCRHMSMLLDRMGKYEDAFLWGEKFNNIQIEMGFAYREKENEALFDSLGKYFTRNNISTLAKASPENKREEKPIYIVGFPRSGTTMAEQIISAHPRVAAGDELHIVMLQREQMRKLVGTNLGYPECLEALSGDNGSSMATKLRSDFLKRERLAGLLTPGVDYFTDKTPLNEVHLGYLHLIFPEAPVVHLIRHPLDVAVSCYFNDIRHDGHFSTRLESIAKHYSRTMDLVEQYKRELDLNYMPVRYEDIVENVEGKAREMIDFIGLDWDQSCVEFQKNKRKSKSARYAQVSEKVYTSSMKRYEHYRKWLEPIIPILEPYIERYGYDI